MQTEIHLKGRKVVVLGSGGTIAGTAARADDNVGYSAAQLGVAQLLAVMPALQGAPIEAEQVAQIDSRDMGHAVWLALAQRSVHHLARDDVAGIVVTHGTDTLEETAYFLHRVLAPTKPLVLTAAMRPATALAADGPQNLLDAVTVARSGGCGVLVVAAGSVHGAVDVTKSHPYRVDAFGSGDAGRLGCVEEGRLTMFRRWPPGEPLRLSALPADPAQWPRVEIVTSHAGASGLVVRALCDAGAADGIVVAATGNGTVHHALLAALREAQANGVAVLLASRCAEGRIVGTPDAGLPWVADLSPVKARIELLLRLVLPQQPAG